MRLLFFFLLFLILLPIASASSVERRIDVSNVYFNSSSGYIQVNKEYKITLTPTPYDDFNMPGYYITEYLPRGFTLITTNADKYTLTDNKLQVLKFIPPRDNLTLTYTLQYKKEFDPTPSFYGTYLDENRIYGVITQYTESSGTSSSSTIVQYTTPTVTYEKPITPSVILPSTATASEFIPLPSSSVQVIPVSTDSGGLGILIWTVFFAIIGIAFVILRPAYYKEFNVKLLSSGDVLLNKKPIGVTKEIKFTLNTKNPLSVKIKGDISKIVTSIQEVQCNKKCYIITVDPDGKEHESTVTFKKKNTKIMKYKVKK